MYPCHAGPAPTPNYYICQATRPVALLGPLLQSLPRLASLSAALPAQLSELSLVPEFAPPQKPQTSGRNDEEEQKQQQQRSAQHITIKNN